MNLNVYYDRMNHMDDSQAIAPFFLSSLVEQVVYNKSSKEDKKTEHAKRTASPKPSALLQQSFKAKLFDNKVLPIQLEGNINTQEKEFHVSQADGIGEVALNKSLEDRNQGILCEKNIFEENLHEKRLYIRRRLPGLLRQNFPSVSPLGSKEKEIFLTSLLSSCPSYSLDRLKMLFLFREFNFLLSKCQPERHWNLNGKYDCVERFSHATFAQIIGDIIRQKPTLFIDSRYVPTQDMLLVAVHERRMPLGRGWVRYNLPAITQPTLLQAMGEGYTEEDLKAKMQEQQRYCNESAVMAPTNDSKKASGEKKTEGSNTTIDSTFFDFNFPCETHPFPPGQYAMGDKLSALYQLGDSNSVLVERHFMGRATDEKNNPLLSYLETLCNQLNIPLTPALRAALSLYDNETATNTYLSQLLEGKPKVGTLEFAERKSGGKNMLEPVNPFAITEPIMEEYMSTGILGINSKNTNTENVIKRIQGKKFLMGSTLNEQWATKRSELIEDIMKMLLLQFLLDYQKTITPLEKDSKTKPVKGAAVEPVPTNNVSFKNISEYLAENENYSRLKELCTSDIWISFDDGARVVAQLIDIPQTRLNTKIIENLEVAKSKSLEDEALAATAGIDKKTEKNKIVEQDKDYGRALFETKNSIDLYELSTAESPEAALCISLPSFDTNVQVFSNGTVSILRKCFHQSLGNTWKGIRKNSQENDSLMAEHRAMIDWLIKLTSGKILAPNDPNALKQQTLGMAIQESKLKQSSKGIVSQLTTPIATMPSQYEFGSEMDVEISHSITSYGTIVRQLLSGRIEMFFPDGSCSVRNPTLAELQQNKQQVLSFLSGTTSSNEATNRIGRSSMDSALIQYFQTLLSKVSNKNPPPANAAVGAQSTVAKSDSALSNHKEAKELTGNGIPLTFCKESIYANLMFLFESWEKFYAEKTYTRLEDYLSRPLDLERLSLEKAKIFLEEKGFSLTPVQLARCSFDSPSLPLECTIDQNTFPFLYHNHVIHSIPGHWLRISPLGEKSGRFSSTSGIAIPSLAPAVIDILFPPSENPADAKKTKPSASAPTNQSTAPDLGLLREELKLFLSNTLVISKEELPTLFPHCTSLASEDSTLEYAFDYEYSIPSSKTDVTETSPSYKYYDPVRNETHLKHSWGVSSIISHDTQGTLPIKKTTFWDKSTLEVIDRPFAMDKTAVGGLMKRTINVYFPSEETLHRDNLKPEIVASVSYQINNKPAQRRSARKMILYLPDGSLLHGLFAEEAERPLESELANISIEEATAKGATHNEQQLTNSFYAMRLLRNDGTIVQMMTGGALMVEETTPANCLEEKHENLSAFELKASYEQSYIDWVEKNSKIIQSIPFSPSYIPDKVCLSLPNIWFSNLVSGDISFNDSNRNSLKVNPRTDKVTLYISTDLEENMESPTIDLPNFIHTKTGIKGMASGSFVSSSGDAEEEQECLLPRLFVVNGSDGSAMEFLSKEHSRDIIAYAARTRSCSIIDNSMLSADKGTRNGEVDICYGETSSLLSESALANAWKAFSLGVETHKERKGCSVYVPRQQILKMRKLCFFAPITEEEESTFNSRMESLAKHEKEKATYPGKHVINSKLDYPQLLIREKIHYGDLLPPFSGMDLTELLYSSSHAKKKKRKH